MHLKTLTILELRNLYGLNVLRHTKDTKEKRKKIALSCIMILAILILLSYVGGLSFGLIYLGLPQVVPAYLVLIASMLILFLGIFKAGSMLFHQNGYDILCSLPISQGTIVLSRILRMYVENLILTFGVLLPGLGVYVFLMKPGIPFYVFGILGIFLLPLLPMTATVFIGALITGISSRMKHKNLVTTALSIFTVLALLLGSSKLSAVEDNITPEMLAELSDVVLNVLQKIYPPAIWLGNAIAAGNPKDFLLFAVLSLGVFVTVSIIVTACFQPICRGLHSTSAKHNYQMQNLKQSSVLMTLCKKELKRYFASSIYVTNTIIGPIMGTVLSGAFLFLDMEQMLGQFPLEVNVKVFAPFLVASVFCTMTITCTSISMEGANWWIAKSLPLTTKTILDAKILMNILVILPFYLVSEILLVIALKPGILELLFFLLVPACIILFACVFGITINLLFPVFNWETEVSVVKQSASAAIGGFGGMLFGILWAIISVVIPKEYIILYQLGCCVITLGITGLLYYKNNKTQLY